MFQKALAATIARELRIATTTVEQTHRRLLETGRISGKGTRAKSSPRVNARDTARTIIALLMSEQPIETPTALDRASGLVAIVGDREQELVAALELTLTELMDQGHLGDVVDFKLTVGRPWPIGAIEMTFADGGERLVEFHHRDALGPNAESRLAALEQRWGYRPGANRWATIGLAELTAIADVMVGRTRQQRPSLADMFATGMRLPSGGTALVMARAGGAPALVKRTRSGRPKS